MDAQQGGKAACQHRLKGQWQPTYKQPNGHATCQRTSVAGQPSAGYSAKQLAHYSLHKACIGGGNCQMKRLAYEFRLSRTYRRTL